jgi:hypothetical protein
MYDAVALFDYNQKSSKELTIWKYDTIKVKYLSLIHFNFLN